jgi:hypothetical protein
MTLDQVSPVLPLLVPCATQGQDQASRGSKPCLYSSLATPFPCLTNLGLFRLCVTFELHLEQEEADLRGCHSPLGDRVMDQGWAH